MQKTAKAAMLMASVLLVAAANVAHAVEIVGWKEKVRIPAMAVDLTTKNDTGAESASLHAENIEVFEKNGADWVRFDVVIQEGDEEDDKNHKTIDWEARVADTVRIKAKGDDSERRYMIELDLCMGHIHRRVEVNLADRSGFSTRMLLGREFLRGAALIDPEREFIREPACTGPVVDAVDD